MLLILARLSWADVYATATVEDPNTGIIRTICSAFFVYVTCRDANGVRPKVPKLEKVEKHLDDDDCSSTTSFSEDMARGKDEWLTFVAAERRKMLPATCGDRAVSW